MTIKPDFAEKIYWQAVQQGKISGKKAVIIYLKDSLDKKLSQLSSTFPDTVFHSIAVKSQAHPLVLEHIVSRGFGLEAASFGEVLLAKDAGASNDRIVFDSPVKTWEEIDKCHREYPGITMNANSLQELERYPNDFSGKIGLRINPMHKSDAPGIFNLSSQSSKFGVPINKYDEILKSCLHYQQISGLHVHIGSRIRDFSKNIKAVKDIKQLADHINNERQKNGIYTTIDFIDIGGGIDFSSDDPQLSMDEFVRQLKSIEGFFENYSVITEYGNFIHQTNSFVVSDIEYVVNNDVKEPSLVFIHVGADLFVRKVYSNLKVDYPVHAFHTDQRVVKQHNDYRIVGPLCFEGDILFDRVTLPEIKQGDKLLILNTGSNTLSMWSRHCNRKEPEFLFV